VEIKVPIEPDKEGYLDKECPNADCQSLFKVHQEDWDTLVKGEGMFCPVCRHDASLDHWHTTAQVERAKEIAYAKFERELGKALRSSTKKFNRRQSKNSFIGITMKYRGKPKHIPLPPQAADPMNLKTTCEECGCRYSVIGYGFFCPACGHNSADATFDQAMSGVRQTLGSIEKTKAALAETDVDAAEQTVRMILEKSIDQGVMSFQRFAEAGYPVTPQSKPPRRNAFQNLVEGSTLWKQATGKGYDDILENDDFTSLRIHFQQRHLFAHREGIVDADYIQKSGDTRYGEGQRIVLKPEAILEFVSNLEKLVVGLRISLGRKAMPPFPSEKSSVPHSSEGIGTPPEVASNEPDKLDRLCQHMEVGQTAGRLAHWVCEESPDGLNDPIMFDAIQTAFPGIQREKLEEACFELEHHGFVGCSAAMGWPVRHIKPEYDLYWFADPIVMGTSPEGDAVTLAELVLQDDQFGSSSELHAATNWSKRRFNPALAYILPYIDEGRVRRTMQPDYVVAGFSINNEDRFQLKQFLKEFSEK